MKKYTAILIVIMLIGLTGCSNNKIVLTNEQNDMVAEYIAGIVLKYDKNYTEKLIYEVTPEATLQATTEPIEEKPSASPDSEATLEPGDVMVEEEQYVELDKIFLEKDFEIVYSEYELYDSYPQSKGITDFSLEAQSGSKLFVVKFDIKNTTNKKKEIKLFESKLKYSLNIDENNKYYAAITPLLNDMQYLEMNIGANDTKQAVVIFEIDEQLMMNNMDFYIQNSNATAVINLK